MKLHLLEVIGQGGYGTVYKALWKGTIVAAKVLVTDNSTSCKEADILKYVILYTIMFCLVSIIVYCTRMVHHPNISPILAVESVEVRKIAMITPLVRGKNLQQILFEGDGNKVISSYIATT